MLLRPSSGDVRAIGFYTGRVVLGVGLAMLLPAALAFVLGEYSDGHAFLLGAGLAIATGQASALALRTRRDLSASQGMASVALAWLTAPLFAAIPLLLSGHYAGYLDAYFEAMSGFATIGLTLAGDLDHMARSVNFWRHLMQFLGGQGIIIVMLTVFAVGGRRIGVLYTGEGREEKILPNVAHTARFIWRVAFAYGLIGTTLLWTALVAGGIRPLSGLYHATALFMAAFDTGGFAVQSSSVAFYRSPVVEALLLVIMTAGAFSFALHYQLWQGRRSELRRNLETRTIAISTLAVFTVMIVGLARSGTFGAYGPLLRHGLFHAISAHTTTGLATVSGTMYLTDWGVLAPAMLVAGMALGGMAGSTAGGVKGLRIGLLLKGLSYDLRRVLLPPDAVVVSHYHAGGRRLLDTRQVRAAITLLLLWLGLYFAGAMIALAYGYDLRVALFDSVAAASSGGLSVGMARPELETPLKLVLIAQMLLGRLEFIAVFALVGYLAAMLRGRV